MRFLWISGWAVPPSWLAEEARAAIPEAEHAVVSPSGASNALATQNFHVLGGYSLGALWLLMHQQEIPENTPVVLLAPFFSFVAETDDGGRVARAQLRLQRRQLRRDAPAAIADFYRRSGLNNIPSNTSEWTAAQITTLDTELGWLENWRATPPPPKPWLGFVGEDDLLLDAYKLREKWPALHVVPNAGHAPGPLLRAAAQEFQLKVRQ